MNLQQFIEAKKAEFDEKFPPQGNHAFRINVNLMGEQATDFLAAALREASLNTIAAVNVLARQSPERESDEYDAGFAYVTWRTQLRAALTAQREAGKKEGFDSVLEKAREAVKSWQNDGDKPTEADLVLENVLKALDQLRITDKT